MDPAPFNRGDRGLRRATEGFSLARDALQRARDFRSRVWLLGLNFAAYGSKARSLERLPEIPGRRPIDTAPRLADLQHALGVGPLRAADTAAESRRRCPRSPAGRTSGRCRRNIRNISAVQRPNPFTAISRSITCFVRQRLELVELQPAVDDARRQIAQVADLLSAQPDRPQRASSLCAAIAAASGMWLRRETARRSGRRSSPPPWSTAAG